jgi:dTDP-4-amino-4,6-dideoxygalactose transaminase
MKLSVGIKRKRRADSYAVPRRKNEDAFPGWPVFDADELAAALRVLQSGRINYWTGEEGRQFEREYAAYTGTKYAVALSNGTVALELALRALGIGPGDEVITSSRTFIASASCAALLGATPVLADVDRDSGNLTAETIRPLISARTKAIVAVHLGGRPCDMDPILDLAHLHGLKVVEDCAQAHGARYKGRPVGSMGDINAFSFCQDKIITTGGEGGLITTNDEQLWRFVWAFKDHGKSYDAVYNHNDSVGFRWLHEGFGTNARMTEMQAVLGRIGLRKLDESVRQRRANAGVLAGRFSEYPVLRVGRPPDDVYHAYYRFYAYVCSEVLKGGWSRDRILKEISSTGVPCSVGSCGEIYLEKAFGDYARTHARSPIARGVAECSLAFLVHPTLTERDMNRMADRICGVLRNATK